MHRAAVARLERDFPPERADERLPERGGHGLRRLLIAQGGEDGGSGDGAADDGGADIAAMRPEQGRGRMVPKPGR